MPKKHYEKLPDSQITLESFMVKRMGASYVQGMRKTFEAMRKGAEIFGILYQEYLKLLCQEHPSGAINLLYPTEFSARAVGASVHHIRPFSLGGNNKLSNLSLVNDQAHNKINNFIDHQAGNMKIGETRKILLVTNQVIVADLTRDDIDYMYGRYESLTGLKGAAGARKRSR
ncbi:MAG: HNH endonuclease [Alphaproteobacteria bacterium]|nr:HNH endonuclease [Alphaproteobacteria bacterium]